jgi:hypothetical protein
MRKVDALIDYIISEEGVRSFNEDRDAVRMYDCLAHLERETYEDLILALAEYEDTKQVESPNPTAPAPPASSSPLPIASPKE